MPAQLVTAAIAFDDHCNPYITRGVQFDAFVGPERRVVHCTVSDEALMADFGFTGHPDRDACKAAYLTGRGAIQAIARWKIKNGQFDQGSEDRIMIKSGDRRLAAGG